MDFVNFLLAVFIQNGVEDRPDVIGRRLVTKGWINRQQVDMFQPSGELRALLADGDNLTLDAAIAVDFNGRRKKFEHVVVISAGQATVASDHDVEPGFDFALIEQWVRLGFLQTSLTAPANCRPPRGSHGLTWHAPAPGAFCWR